MRALACAAALLIAAPLAAQDVAPEPDEAAALAYHHAQQAYIHGLAYEDGWAYYLPGGLKYRRIEGDGSGARPTVADTVSVHYEGRFIDGEVFDSSYERGEPATFPLGRLIRGWQLAIPEMGVGDKVEMAIPAMLAYGAEGRGPIPGGATLVFTVELLGIEGR